METVVKKLSELIIGEMAQIGGYMSETAESLRLQEMGLLPGTKLQITRKGATGYPLEIQARGYRLALRKEDAELLYLEG